MNLFYVELHMSGYANICDMIQCLDKNWINIAANEGCLRYDSKCETTGAGPMSSFKTSLERHLAPHEVRFFTHAVPHALDFLPLLINNFLPLLINILVPPILSRTSPSSRSPT